MFLETFRKLKIISAISLITIGVLGRFFLINYIGIPNFEIITALTLVSAVFLGRVWGVVVPLSIIAITDAFIGNSPVLIFTWSAFAMIGVFGWLFSKSKVKSQKSKVIGLTGVGIFSSIFFFLYTNFGWWLMSSMYPHTLDGLIQCYIMGLPFFKNNLIGNLIFVPMASGVAMCVISLKSKLKNQNEKLQLKVQKLITNFRS